MLELESEGFLFSGAEGEIDGDGGEGGGFGGEMVGAGGEIGEGEAALRVRGGFGDSGVEGGGEFEMGLRDGRAFGVEDGAGELGKLRAGEKEKVESEKEHGGV